MNRTPPLRKLRGRGANILSYYFGRNKQDRNTKRQTKSKGKEKQKNSPTLFFYWSKERISY